MPSDPAGLLSLYRLAPLKPEAGWGTRAYTPAPSEPDAAARRAAFDALTGPLAVPWWGDSLIYLWPTEQLSAAIAQTGAFELSTAVALHALLKPGHGFVDVGANSGVYTVAARRWVGEAGRVVAVEPSPREFNKLTANLDLNGMSDVAAVQAALGAAPGRGALLVAPDAYAGMNTLAPRFGNFDGPVQAVTEVEVRTLDEICGSMARVDVIKADVEGAEADLLRGGMGTLRRHRPALILEAAPTVALAYGSSIEELASVLQTAGYRCFGIDEASAALVPLSDLAGCNGDNIVALPIEGRVRPDAAQLSVTGL
jgi:FkbM family methyltransferase